MVLSLSVQADTLVLSSKLKLDYPTPLLISHTENTLIIKYKETAISHNIVTPKTMYTDIDLTGYEQDYIYALFDKKVNKELPEPIKELALQQKKTMGLNEKIGVFKKTDYFEILASYDERQNIGHVFILEEHNIHHLAVDGSQEYLNKIINGIAVR